MKQSLEFIVKSLVDNKDAVVVEEREDGNFIHMLVSVHTDDMGKVIGRNGKIANAIRVLMRSLAKNQNKRIAIKIGE